MFFQKNNMNILMLNWKDIKHPQVGGAEIIVYEIAKRMVKDGHKVTLFCRRFIYSKQEEIIDGIHVVRRGNLITMYLHATAYYWTLRNKPDLVIDMSNTIYWQTPLWAFKSKKIAYLNQLALDVFKYEYNWVLALFGGIAEKLQYLTYKNTPFICYSESTKQDLEAMGVPEKNISVFSLGIDHKRYKPGEKAKYPLFLCVSRLVKMKRTDLVIKAMKYVVAKHKNAKLAIVGYGYDRKRLELLRNYLELENNVFFQDENILFFGQNVKDEKVKTMQAAWALVFPSVKEGWGMTVTECAACGTPTIATNVTGLKDSVVNGKTGVLVSENPTPEEIANEMMKLIENEKLRSDMSKNAILWSKQFDWDRSYSEFIGIIKKVTK
jgi:glycosyltransferase involved in cell wall biosynthesis